MDFSDPASSDASFNYFVCIIFGNKPRYSSFFSCDPYRTYNIVLTWHIMSDVDYLSLSYLGKVHGLVNISALTLYWVD